jgi:hypothetical protein
MDVGTKDPEAERSSNKVRNRCGSYGKFHPFLQRKEWVSMLPIPKPAMEATAPATMPTRPPMASKVIGGEPLYAICAIWAKTTPPSADKATTAQGGSFQSISKARAPAARAKSAGALMALVHTGL